MSYYMNNEAYSTKEQAHTIRPIVLKQLKKVEYDAGVYNLDAQPLYIFKVIGRLMSIHSSEYTIMYTIDDGTGSVQFVFRWSKYDSHSMHSAIEQESYVRVYGRCNNNHNFGINIAPVTDYNEVSFHQLEVIYHHFKLDR